MAARSRKKQNGSGVLPWIALLLLAVVVATFGWASFQGFAFDVRALDFAGAAPLGEASVEGLLGVLAALMAVNCECAPRIGTRVRASPTPDSVSARELRPRGVLALVDGRHAPLPQSR